MQINEPLFHGTNSNDIIKAYFAQQKTTLWYLVKKWTTGLDEAIGFAALSVKRYGGGLVVLVLPQWKPENFNLISLHNQGAIIGDEIVKWYRTTSKLNPKAVEQRLVEVYSYCYIPVIRTTEILKPNGNIRDLIRKYSKNKVYSLKYIENYDGRLE